MTFETRDQYRHVVERLARRTGRPEEQVGRDRGGSRPAPAASPSAASSHVGFFLLGAGRASLEQSVGYRPPSASGCSGPPGATRESGAGGQRNPRHRRRARGTLLDGRRRVPSRLAPARRPRADPGQRGAPQRHPAAAHQLPPTAALAQARLSRGRCPRRVTHRGGGAHAALQRRVGGAGRWSISRCSSSPTADPHLHFALLSDFTDAPTEMRDGRRRPSSQAAVAGSDARSTRATAPGRATPSTCSTVRGAGTRSEGVWMGWERKRGKLADFNHLLRGARDDAFSVVVGDLRRARGVSLRHHARRRHASCRPTPPRA